MCIFTLTFVYAYFNVFLCRLKYNLLSVVAAIDSSDDLAMQELLQYPYARKLFGIFLHFCAFYRIINTSLSSISHHTLPTAKRCIAIASYIPKYDGFIQRFIAACATWALTETTESLQVALGKVFACSTVNPNIYFQTISQIIALHHHTKMKVNKLKRLLPV